MYRFPPQKGDDSPWGAIQHVTKVTEGIYSVSTAGHGGVVLSPERHAAMPECFRNENWLGAEYRYWEEDCSASLPLLVFADDILADDDGETFTKEALINGKIRDWALSCYKEAIEGWIGVKR